MDKTEVKKNKILFFVGGAKVFGREKGILGTMIALKEEGYTIINISNGWNDGVFNELLKKNEISFYVVKLGKISKRISLKYLKWTIDALVHMPFALYQIRRIIKKTKPDIFFFDSPYVFYFVKRFLGPNAKIIIGYHEFPTFNFYMKSLLTWKNSNIIQHYGISNYITTNLRNLGIPETNLSLLYYDNIVKDDEFIQKSKTSNEIIFGFAGQIAERKGLHLIIEAFGILAKNNIHPKLWIAGSGDSLFVDSLKRRAADLGIEHSINWMGYTKDMTQFYNSISVCIVPSIFEEPFGLIPVEAALHGVPSIVSNRGGLVESIIDNKTGFIVTYDNPQAIADKILYFIENPLKIEEFGLEAKKYCTEKFSTEKHITSLQQIIKNLHYYNSL